MIRVRFVGHIKTTMGTEEVDLDAGDITVGDLFSRLLAVEASKGAHGFTKFNTLVVVNDGEVFAAAANEDRRLGRGDTVMLVPFSHGG